MEGQKTWLYVYFSRIEDLIITEQGPDGFLFDYLVDIGEGQKQTGRFFGVEIKVFENSNKHRFSEEKYKNITFPARLVLFDAKTDQGFF